MFHNDSERGGLALTGCAIIALALSGCRSSMPSMDMLGWGSEPSAEALAGSGPTTTYPAPPSTTATPEAIASVAGGTTAAGDAAAPSYAAAGSPSPNAQISAINTSLGTAMPGAVASPVGAASLVPGSPNMAAAQANGIYGSPEDISATTANPYAATASSPHQPSGYQYGTTSPATAAATATSGSSVKPSAYALPGATQPAVGSSSDVATRPTTFGATTFGEAKSTSPAVAAAPAPAPTQLPSTPTSPSPASMSGFTLPPTMASNSTPVAPNTAQSSTAKPTSIAAPGSGSPAYSTASRADTMPQSAPPASAASGYSPGSTSAASGYPASGYTPAPSNGGMYR